MRETVHEVVQYGIAALLGPQADWINAIAGDA
jgi:hypothetical protein